jgi:hypothetical protein
MPLPRKAVIPLSVAALLIGGVATLRGQDAAIREGERQLLVGRTETATFTLTLRTDRPVDDMIPWRHRTPPLAGSTGTGAVLWSDLPLRLGGVEIPAGRHRLRVESDSLLVVARDSTHEVVARVRLADSTGLPVINGWSLAVATTRHGPDTTGVAERRRNGMTVVALSHRPGTSSTLRLRFLDRVLSVPIAAR